MSYKRFLGAAIVLLLVVANDLRSADNSGRKVKLTTVAARKRQQQEKAREDAMAKVRELRESAYQQSLLNAAAANRAGASGVRVSSVGGAGLEQKGRGAEDSDLKQVLALSMLDAPQGAPKSPFWEAVDRMGQYRGAEDGELAQAQALSMEHAQRPVPGAGSKEKSWAENDFERVLALSQQTKEKEDARRQQEQQQDQEVERYLRGLEQAKLESQQQAQLKLQQHVKLDDVEAEDQRQLALAIARSMGK